MRKYHNCNETGKRQTAVTGHKVGAVIVRLKKADGGEWYGCARSARYAAMAAKKRRDA